VVRTNVVPNLRDGEFEPNVPNPFYYSVVCDVGSRINHRSVFCDSLGDCGVLMLFSSCLPNVDYHFKLSAFAIIFYATRDIKAGEQLFYSYCGINQSASERKVELALYGITCACASCVHATPETDALRKTFYARIQEYKTQSLTWNDFPGFPWKSWTIC
jgi:hypothetical protein